MEDKMQDIHEVPENDGDVQEQNKSRLSRTMTIIIVLMVLLFGLMVFLNNYYNG